MQKNKPICPPKRHTNTNLVNDTFCLSHPLKTPGDDYDVVLHQDPVTKLLYVPSYDEKFAGLSSSIKDLDRQISEVASEVSSEIVSVSTDLNKLNIKVDSNKTELEDQISTTNSNIVNLENSVEDITSGLTTVGKARDYDTNAGGIKQEFNNIDRSILQLNDNKLSKVFTDLGLANSLGDNDYLVINSGTQALKIPISIFREAIIEEHYKGDFTSEETLKSTYPIANAGDYAYVNVGDDLVLYIWDLDDNIWKISSASQFVKSSVFTLYQDQILNGTMSVGKAKGYTEDGEIGQKFSQLEKQTIEFSDTVEEGNELSPTVKQIKLGDDIWLIPEGKGVVSYTGAELEEMDFEEGRIYLCTESSASFQLNQLYYGDNDKNIRKLTSSLVSLEPELTTFTLVSPTGTMEVGTSVTSISYSFGLKYPNKLVNSKSELYYGSNLVHTKTSLGTSNSGSVSYSILNSTVGTKNFTLKIYSNNQSKFSSSKSYSVAQRYYYGITSSDVNAQTLTTDLANTNFKNVRENSDTVKTSLSKLSSVTLSIPSNSYVWFLVPSSTSINSATSGGFDFPYQLQGNVTMTNSYGIDLTYKVYRSSNQVYGDITIVLS